MRRTFLGAVTSAALLTAAACTSDGTTNPGGTPVTIDWAPCINDADFPAWFAVQDGSGAWTNVASTGGVFAFTVNSGKVGVATYANGLLTVVYSTSAEMNSYRPSCTGSRRAVSGTITGYTTLDAIDIEMDQGSASVSGTSPAPAAFQLGNVGPGPVDVLAVRSRSTVIPVFQQTPSAVFIRRAQSTSPLATIDLNSTVESGAPLSKTVTVSNAANNESLFALSDLSTSTSSITMSQYSVVLGTVIGNVAALFYGLPATRLSTGETQDLLVGSTKTLSASSSENRFVATTFTDVADKVVALGPTLGTVTVAGSARPSASYAIQTGYDQIFQLDLDQGSGSASKSIRLIMTRSYAGASATAVTLLMPDLTGVSGFLPAWQLSTGTTATWTFYAGSDALGGFNGTAQAYTAANRNATFTP
jgi:hypothetical protein